MSSFSLSNVTSTCSSLVLYFKSLTTSICPRSESPPWYCTKDFFSGSTVHNQTDNVSKYLAGGLCLWACFATVFKDRAGNTITPVFVLPAQHLHRLPSLLQSYLTSSPFTLTLNAVFESMHLAMFHKSEIPWSHRFRAIYIFSSRNGDAAALSVMKRNFFSLVWTITLFLYAPTPSGMARVFMISWTIFSFAAFLIPFLALSLSDGEDVNALDLSVKAQEMGNDKGQVGHLLWDLVNVPTEWRKKFQQSEIGFACWCHALVFAHLMYTQYTAPPKILRTSADGSVESQDLRWTRRLHNIGVVPTAFVSSLAVALFSMYWVPRHREKDIGLRGFSAFWGAYCFAHQLKDMEFSCTWGLWLGCDGMLTVVDEWVGHMQRKRLWLDFEELVRGRLEERPEKLRDIYNDTVALGP